MIERVFLLDFDLGASPEDDSEANMEELQALLQIFLCSAFFVPFHPGAMRAPPSPRYPELWGFLQTVLFRKSDAAIWEFPVGTVVTREWRKQFYALYVDQRPEVIGAVFPSLTTHQYHYTQLMDKANHGRLPSEWVEHVVALANGVERLLGPAMRDLTSLHLTLNTLLQVTDKKISTHDLSGLEEIAEAYHRLVATHGDWMHPERRLLNDARFAALRQAATDPPGDVFGEMTLTQFEAHVAVLVVRKQWDRVIDLFERQRTWLRERMAAFRSPEEAAVVQRIVALLKYAQANAQ